MPNYQQGKIYKICSHQTDKIYVGSTCQTTLARRLSNHRQCMKVWKNGKGKYYTAFDILKYDDAYIELIEEYPCNSKDQLIKREGHYIRKLECVNKIQPDRTPKMYYEEHKEAILRYQKEYYIDNKVSIAARHKKYSQENKDAITKYKKQWRDDNKVSIAAKRKKYRQENKQELKKYYSKKTNCPCGGSYTVSHKAEHFRSKKHKNYEVSI